MRPIWNSLGIDPEKASLQQLREYYSIAFATYPGVRFYLIGQVFNDKRFSELERFDFLAMAMQQDNDLGVLQEACRLMDTKRKSDKNFPRFGDYLNWYKDNRTNFKATP